MKNIYTGFVVDPSIQQPLTAKSLDFLQSGNKEVIAALARTFIVDRTGSYNVSTPYLLENIHGYEVSIFYNNELYLTNAGTITGYAHIDITPDVTADPLQFTDLVNRNVHNNRYLYFDAINTAVLFNASAIIDLTSFVVTPTLLNSWIVSGGATPKYTKRGNQITLQGSALKVGDNTGTIFTLPASASPSVQRVVVCGWLALTVKQFNYLVIDTNGNVSFFDQTGGVGASGHRVYMDGVTFYL